MIARNKSEKLEHLEFLLHHLWHGRTEEVLNYLTKIKTKNDGKLQELITYIEKHQQEIIDYDRRKKAGKEVGLEPDQPEDREVVHNQLPNHAKTEGISMRCNRVNKKRNKSNDANLSQEPEEVKAKEQSSSKAKAVKKIVVSLPCGKSL